MRTDGERARTEHPLLREVIAERYSGPVREWRAPRTRPIADQLEDLKGQEPT